VASPPAEPCALAPVEDVYVDVETGEPVFGTVKEGFIGQLTFMPLHAGVASPDGFSWASQESKCRTPRTSKPPAARPAGRMSPGILDEEQRQRCE
jgi:hypothetical protein